MFSALLAACSGGSTSPSLTTGSTSTSSSVTSTSVPSSTTTSAAAGTTCAVDDLELSVYGSSGAAGTLETTFELHNSSTTTCTLGGYPGAQLLNAAGAPIPTTVARGGTYSFTDFAPTTVSVAPGASVYFNAGYSDVPTGSQSCPTAAQVEVTPPNDFTQLTTSFKATVCGNGTLTVSPVFSAGSTHSQTTAPPQA